MSAAPFDEYDDLIVGAGASGAVMANRLSEGGERRVLLLEAGPHHGDASLTPPELLDARVVAFGSHNWYQPAFLRDEPGRMEPSAANLMEYRVGKVTGGSSAINAAMALRGTPEDYNLWALSCGHGWSWPELLPLFKAIEDDPDGEPAWHGRGGAVPVRRERPDELAPLQAAFFDACLAQGYAKVIDHNRPDALGVGIVPKNEVNGVRMSTALTHLALARERENFHLVSGAHVLRLVWSGGTACAGVEANVAGTCRFYRARRVILCAGALQTPVLLMRSGIGDPSQLEPLGIPVHASLAGVGRNLLEHPSLAFWAVPRDGCSALGEPAHQVMLRYTSTRETGRGDMQIYMLGGIDTQQIPMLREALDAPVGAAVSVCLMKAVSQGHLRLVSADPSLAPRVVINCAAESEDADRLREGARLAWRLLNRPELRSRLDRVFAWTEAMFASDAALDRAIAALARTMQHPAGTARMGKPGDPMAVVDPQGRVHGIDNVWVADASVMPTIPSAPLNLTCMVIAEKIARALASDEEIFFI